MISKKVVLIFPPVWVPMVPHLALPALTAYLRQCGIRIEPRDANAEFFTDYLLGKDVLQTLLNRAEETLGKPEAESPLPEFWRRMGRDELPEWEASVARIEEILNVFRDRTQFFKPDVLLDALDRVNGLMYLAGIAQWPGKISFNHYHRGDIQTAQDLIDLCDDEDRNVFYPFWRDRVLPELKSEQPMILGLSISSIHQFIAALTLTRMVKKQLPKVHVVIGGRHILRIQDKIVENTFYFREFFDSVILNEGERPLVRLYETLDSGGDLNRVPNLIYAADGEIVRTRFEEAAPLNELTLSDFSDVRWDRYLVPNKYAPVRMSEGCYWGKCTFCARYGQERTNFIPTELVLDELESMRDVYGIRDVSVNDDCMPPEYWDELCEGILKRKLDLSMLIWAKPVNGFTKARLEKMAKAGVKQVRWGVESAHPRVLKLMRKGTTLDGTVRVLKDAHDAGIWNHACIILGFPSETREEAETTLEFIRNRSDVIQSFILYSFVLYQHSYIYRHPDEFGIQDIHVASTPFFDTISYELNNGRGMSPGEVQALTNQSKKGLLRDTYDWPFWYYIKLREYLQLYLDRFGLEKTVRMPFDRTGLRRTWAGLGP